MAESPDSWFFEFVETLLPSGHDRIKYRVDKRREPLLTRRGLLSYPDGTYSMTRNAMDNILQYVRVILIDRSVPEARRAELERLLQLGKVWLARHEDPSVRELRFGDLPYSIYKPLWELVTGSRDTVLLDIPSTTKKEKLFWETLAKKGYVDSRETHTTLIFTPNAKGKAFVAEIGSPFALVKSAGSYDYRET